MDVVNYIAAIDEEGARLADAAAFAGLDAAVPSCRDWVVRDLVRHLGGVHRWATAIVSNARTEPWDVDLDEVVGTWPGDADLLGWFAEGRAGLVAALADADPQLVCWTFLEAASPREMWARRQAQETTVHRVDAELAAGRAVSAVAPGFAADGIDELLACFVTRPFGRLRATPPRDLGVRCADTDDAWRVRIAADHVETVRGVAEADCEVRGGASAIYLALWNRVPTEDLVVTGDEKVLELFLDRVHIRWS